MADEPQLLPTQVIATMISCRQRESDRATTRANLLRVGLTAMEFLSPCDDTLEAGPKGNAEVSKRALLYALGTGASNLFCEDDIDLHSSFPAFLQAALRNQGSVTYFYQHEGKSLPHRYGPTVAARILAKQSVTSGLYPLSGPGRRGTQCVLIPPGILKLLPLGELHGAAPIDICLDRWLDRLGIPALVALPNPVQHRHSRVARAPEPAGIKRSLSYDLPRG